MKTEIEMLYDADGNRVKKETVAFSSQTCSDPADSSVKIAGTMPDHIVNSGVAYVDNASVFVKSSFIDPYALSYVNFDDGVSDKDNFFDFYIKDHLGSTRMVLTETGSNGNADGNGSIMLKEATNYLAYGSLRPILPTIEKGDEARKKFTGKEFDEDGVDAGNGVQGIRLDYFGKRAFDPEIGIWIGVDPLAQRYILSPFNYCLDNPTNLTDPDGSGPGLPDPVSAGAAVFMGVRDMYRAEEASYNRGDSYWKTVGIGLDTVMI